MSVEELVWTTRYSVTVTENRSRVCSGVWINLLDEIFQRLWIFCSSLKVLWGDVSEWFVMVFRKVGYTGRLWCMIDERGIYHKIYFSRKETTYLNLEVLELHEHPKVSLIVFYRIVPTDVYTKSTFFTTAQYLVQRHFLRPYGSNAFDRPV